MHRRNIGWLFVLGLFAISVLMAESVLAQDQAIRVMAGTYGGNCNAPHGNKTSHLAAACNGRADCTYKVDYTVIGDPAVGCGKDYVAEWRCGGSRELHRVVANPEAGFGSTLTLQCEQPVASGTGIQVMAGTYGENCKAPHGNKTSHLAAACNGRADCTYKIDYTVIGDPAVGCGKDYVAEWRCGGSRELHRVVANPEAGFGSTLTLQCEQLVASGTGIQVMAGTYGENCNAPHGNKTSHLAAACNGRADCTYKIDYTVIGDPAVGCGKDYVAEWRCGGSREVRRTAASPEAGFGKTVELSCSQ